MLRTAIITLLLASAGCTFAPTVDGVPINDCSDHADCPACGRCVKGVCVPAEPPLADLVVRGNTVAPGETCEFEIVRPSCAATFRWLQIVGERAILTVSEDGTSAQLPTVPAVVGSYRVQVRATTPEGQVVTATGACATLEDDAAAFLVYQATGTSCTRTDPCGSFDDIRDGPGLQRHVYLGVAEDHEGPAVFLPITPDTPGLVDLRTEFNGVQIHGGFVYPGWTYDTQRSQTSLAGDDELLITCNSCRFTGLTQTRVVPPATGTNAIRINNATNVSLQDITVVLTGGAATSAVVGVSDGAVNSNLSGLLVTTSRLTVDTLVGIRQSLVTDVFSVIRDSTVLLDDATADDKLGVDVADAMVLDRVWVSTGGAVDMARGLLVRCGEPHVTNSVFDARGGFSVHAIGVNIDTFPYPCAPNPRFHSVLMIGGSGDRSVGIAIDELDSASELTNCIIDAGDGSERYAISWDADYVGLRASMFRGSVLVVPPGAPIDSAAGQSWTDAVGLTEYSDVASLEAGANCFGCFILVDDVHHVDRAASDFHLTAESSCCVDSGVNLEAGDPQVDYEGVPRPTSGPSVGPYQWVP